MPWYFFTFAGAPKTPDVLLDVPTGHVFMFGGAMSGTDGTEAQAKSAPTGYLFCNGAEVLQSEFPSLYAVVGTKFGTAASPGTHFVLPNYLSGVPIGHNSGDVDFNAVGNSGGSLGHSHSLADHDHDLNDHTHTLLNHTHSIPSHNHSIPNHTHATGSAGGATYTTRNVDENSGVNFVNSDPTGSPKVNVAPIRHIHELSGNLSSTPSPATSSSTSGTTSNPVSTTTTVGGSMSATTSSGALDAGGAPVSLSLPTQTYDNIPPYVSTTYLIKI